MRSDAVSRLNVCGAYHDDRHVGALSDTGRGTSAVSAMGGRRLLSDGWARRATGAVGTLRHRPPSAVRLAGA